MSHERRNMDKLDGHERDSTPSRERRPPAAAPRWSPAPPAAPRRCSPRSSWPRDIKPGENRRLRHLRGVARRHPAQHARLRVGHHGLGARRALGVRRRLAAARRGAHRGGDVRPRRAAGAHRARGPDGRRQARLHRLARRDLQAVRPAPAVRRELFRIIAALKKMGVTAVMTAERSQEYGDIARYGVEEFVADNVVILRNVLDDEKRRRTIEILKFRGTIAPEGRVPVHDHPQRGHRRDPALGDRAEAEVLGRPDHLGQRRARPDVRRRLLPRLDHPRLRRDRHRQDAHGLALPRGRRERRRAHACSSPSRRAASSSSATPSGWGVDFERMEREGLLKVVCDYPERHEPRGSPDPA